MNLVRIVVIVATVSCVALLLASMFLQPSVSPTTSLPPASDAPDRKDNDKQHTPSDAKVHSSLSLELDKTDVAGECYRGEKQWWRPARCPSDEWWLEPWVKLRPKAKWTMVAVGANKGYGLTSWMEHLAGTSRTPYNGRRLGIQLFNSTKQFGTMSHCGGCCECVEAPIVVDTQHAADHVKVIAFEPGPATVRHLRTFFDDTGIFDIRWKAVSAASGRAFFPDVPLGKETGHLVSDNSSEGKAHLAAGNSKFNLTGVDVVALDEELETLYRHFPDDRRAKHSADKENHVAAAAGGEAYVSGVDVLQTDVEGFDQDVARGAKKLLSSGKVGVYIFEMNRVENYTAIFGWLNEAAGFECYFGTERRFISGRWQHLPPFVRITGRCWKPEYEGYSGWINAVCVHRERAKELLPVFGSLTRLRRKMMMACAGRKRQQKVVGRFLSKYLAAELKEFEKNHGQ